MSHKINTWRKFAKSVRAKEEKLLYRLPQFRSPVLISGCQRSGTTLLTQIFLESGYFEDFRSGNDSELDGALILSGISKPDISKGRYCFQTTYLNERFIEYFEYPEHFKLIFLIRNPFSVVYSMCYHWANRYHLTNFALNELFLSCGDKTKLSASEKIRLNLFGVNSISKLQKACLSYVGKTSQVCILANKLKNNLLVIEYDELTEKKEIILDQICSVVDLPIKSLSTELIHNQSINRADRLSPKEKDTISKLCLKTYKQARKLAFKYDNNGE